MNKKVQKLLDILNEMEDEVADTALLSNAIYSMKIAHIRTEILSTFCDDLEDCD